MTGRVMRLLAVCVCLTAFGAYAPALGQDGAAGQAAEKQAKEADIRRLLNLMGAGKVGTQMMDQMFNAIRGSMTQEVPRKVWDDLVAEFKSEFSADTLVELSVPIYAKHYTHDEIRQLIAFYESPLGQKVSSVTPLLVKDGYEAGAAHSRQLMRRIFERLRSKGYKPPVI